MKILIAGAGIGGLTAALCLLEQGHEVSLYEQTTELSDIGAGIQLGANAVKVLAWLGVQEELHRVALEPEAINFRLFSDARVLLTSPLGEDYAQRYGAPYYHIHRADLQSVLFNKLNSIAPNALHLGCSVTAYQEQHNGVALLLSNGERVLGDCLIGADGIRSIIRQQLVGDVKNQPRWTGNVAWRGVVPACRLPDNFMQTAVHNFVGPHKHMVMYYVRNKQLVNFVGVVEHQQRQAESWTAKAPWRQLKADFDGWHRTVQAVIDAADKDQCYRFALHDHTPLANWCAGRVALLGDAAHATLPFMASGAAMAIEDARILSRALAADDNVAAALQRYQDNRFERTRRVQKLSRQIARIYHLPNSLALRLAFFMIAKKRNRPDEWLPQYDANTVELK